MTGPACARPLRRAIENYVEDPLSEELLRGAFEGKTRILVTVKEVADQKQLDFVGTSAGEGDLVGAGSVKESSPPSNP